MGLDFNDVRSIAWSTVLEMFGLVNSNSSIVIFQAPSYTVSTLPSASTYPRGIIYVSNQSTGAEPAFSDGTNWRIFSTRAIVS